jgi:hypothetical protein
LLAARTFHAYLWWLLFLPSLGCRRFFCTTTSLKEPFFVALQTGGFTVGTPARLGDGRRRPSIRVGLLAETPESVFAHWRSVEAWYRDGPSLLRWRLRTPGTTSGRPDQSSTRRNRRSTLISLDLLQPDGSRPCILVCLAKRSPALQACNRMRNNQADGVPRRYRAPEVQPCLRSFFAFLLSVAGVYALKTHRHPSATLRFSRLFVVKRRPSSDSLSLSFANWPSALPLALRPVRGISTGR